MRIINRCVSYLKYRFLSIFSAWRVILSSLEIRFILYLRQMKSGMLHPGNRVMITHQLSFFNNPIFLS